MRRLPIPWTDESEELIQHALKQTHFKKHFEIVEQYRLLNLKKTIQEYGIANFNISDMSLAKGLHYFQVLNHDKES